MAGWGVPSLRDMVGCDARDDDMARPRFGEEEKVEEADVRIANDLEELVSVATNATMEPAADLATYDGAADVDDDAVSALARSSWSALGFMVVQRPKNNVVDRCD